MAHSNRLQAPISDRVDGTRPTLRPGDDGRALGRDGASIPAAEFAGHRAAADPRPGRREVTRDVRVRLPVGTDGPEGRVVSLRFASETLGSSYSVMHGKYVRL